MEEQLPLPIAMTAILASLVLFIYILSEFQYKIGAGNFLPSTDNNAKREFEKYSLGYSVIWIAVFAVVIVFKLYEEFDENSYMALGVSLAAPLLLQPFFYPMPSERNLPYYLRYSFKANVWIAIFSFIGNYWYTHYFYSVLQARYSFKAHRLNDVPIALFFCTHFYFMTYHTFSNLLLRKIETRYAAGLLRSAIFWSTVFAFSYFTAFMETLTISEFPYYHFPPELKRDIYIKGSAFYGIYFIVSFPLFYRVDEKVNAAEHRYPHTVFQTVLEAFGGSMIVLCLLDFCRLGLGIALKIGGKAFEITLN